MIRTIIQIAVCPLAPGDEPIVYALCDDGSTWQLTYGGQWVELPAIPQNESHDPLTKLHTKKVDLENTVSAVQVLADKYIAHVSPIVNKIGNEIHAAIVTAAINNEEGK